MSDTKRQLADVPPETDNAVANMAVPIEFTMNEWAGIAAGLEYASQYMNSGPMRDKMLWFGTQIRDRLINKATADMTKEFLATGKVPEALKVLVFGE